MVRFGRDGNHDKEEAVRKCQYCAEEIQQEAQICKHCGKRVKTSPITKFIAWTLGILFGIPLLTMMTRDTIISPSSAPLSPPQAPGCNVSDIGVDKLNGRVDGDWIYIAGRLINNCARPTGVQIKVTIYDKGGNILTVHDPWPASVNNIPARSDFPFEDMIQRVEGFANSPWWN